MEKHQTKDEAARVREMADALGYFTEEDFRTLAGATPLTVEAWRKRGQGPDYVRLGRRFFYPRESVRAFLQKSTRQRHSHGGALL